jgi:hypothetical protein
MPLRPLPLRLAVSPFFGFSEMRRSRHFERLPAESGLEIDMAVSLSARRRRGQRRSPPACVLPDRWLIFPLAPCRQYGYYADSW